MPAEPRAADSESPRRRSRLLRAGTGIGMRNVRERMQVLCGPDSGFEILSRPGRGTRVVLTLPLHLAQHPANPLPEPEPSSIDA